MGLNTRGAIADRPGRNGHDARAPRPSSTSTSEHEHEHDNDDGPDADRLKNYLMYLSNKIGLEDEGARRSPGHGAVARSHAPKPGRGREGWKRFRSCARLDFGFRCAYCGAHESEVRTGKARMHLDHHRPRAKFLHLANTHDNIYLACPECNEAKGALWPDEAELAAGQRFIDVCGDVAQDHLEFDGTEARAKDDSPVGEFTVSMLDLNDPVHLARRERHIQLRANLRSVRSALTKALRLPVAQQRRAGLVGELSRMQANLEGQLPIAPPDAPSSCSCGKATSE